MDTGVLKLIGCKTLQQESFYSDTLVGVGWKPYLIIEYIVICHKYNFNHEFYKSYLRVFKD